MTRPGLQMLRSGAVAALMALPGCGDSAPTAPTAQAMSIEDFRRELVNLPLCGTPATGPLAGKSICTVHVADGTATLAGAGIVARFIWDAQGRAICRRDPRDGTAAERQCVTYERLSNGRYRNSDGVEFCLGPCRAQ
jgi:YD repeat-containing protein